MPAASNSDSDILVLLDSAVSGQQGEGFRRIYHTTHTFYCSGAGGGAVSLQATPNPQSNTPDWYPIGTIAPGNTLTLVGVFPGLRAVKDNTADAKKVWVASHVPPGR